MIGQYLVTKSVPAVQQLKREIPVLRHLEGSFYLRQVSCDWSAVLASDWLAPGAGRAVDWSVREPGEHGADGGLGPGRGAAPGAL